MVLNASEAKTEQISVEGMMYLPNLDSSNDNKICPSNLTLSSYVNEARQSDSIPNNNVVKTGLISAKNTEYPPNLTPSSDTNKTQQLDDKRVSLLDFNLFSDEAPLSDLILNESVVKKEPILVEGMMYSPNLDSSNDKIRPLNLTLSSYVSEARRSDSIPNSNLVKTGLISAKNTEYPPNLTPSSDANKTQPSDSNPFYENYFPPERNPFDPSYRPPEPKRVDPTRARLDSAKMTAMSHVIFGPPSPPELNPSSNEKEDLQLKRHMHLGLEGKENFRHMYTEESTSYPKGENKSLEKNPVEQTGVWSQGISEFLASFWDYFKNIRIFGA